MTMQQPDPRNAEILVHVGGRLVPREQASVSVFDSSVQGGDAVWEGLRVYDGRIAELDAHLDRLRRSAHALAFTAVPDDDTLRRAVFDTLAANGMRDGVHVRLTLTRGAKVTSGMNPRLNQSGPCLIVLAEWKPPIYGDAGIRLITAATRRNTPQCLDSKIHHNNLLNNILACIEANVAGADGALMLDVAGFVSETNDTNVFLVTGGQVLTPHADSCLPGITRGVVLRLCAEEHLDVRERNLSLTEFYTADEVFTTGTIGELTPVIEIDGRRIGTGTPGPLTRQLSRAHNAWVRARGTALPA
jgi:branched-chain amino acid aminotransferase